MRIALTAILVCALFGCKKKEEPSASTTAATGTGSAAAPASPAAPASATDQPSTPRTSGEAVDICALVTKEQVGAALGGAVEGDPKPTAAQGSLLGMCDWSVGDVTGSISARPANEFEATARKGNEVAGIGEKALMTKHGLMVKVAGKPYFLHVMVMGLNGNDEAKATELAKAAVAGIK